MPGVAYTGHIYAAKIPATALFDLSDHHSYWHACSESFLERVYQQRSVYCADIVPNADDFSHGFSHYDRRVHGHEVFV